MNDNAIIRVTQLPVIEDEARLRALKDYWEQKAKDADATVCTEENKQALKKERAEMRKEHEAMEQQRKAALAPALEIINRFNAIFKDCVTDSFNRADGLYKSKIEIIEQGQKKACEDGLREYFAELCAAEHIDFLRFEQVGVKVDLASAKQKTPKKLREQIAAFVTGVARDVDTIAGMEDAEDLLAEYRVHLSLSAAIHAVDEHHRRVEEAKERLERHKAAQEVQQEAVAKVEAVAPPVAVEPPVSVEQSPERDVSPRYKNAEGETIFKCVFTAFGTKTQLLALREFLKQEGIRYE